MCYGSKTKSPWGDGNFETHQVFRAQNWCRSKTKSPWGDGNNTPLSHRTLHLFLFENKIPVRGRKLIHPFLVTFWIVRKQNPREGTETLHLLNSLLILLVEFENKIPVRGRKQKGYTLTGVFSVLVRKQNPREGTETRAHVRAWQEKKAYVRKQNPREGTETIINECIKQYQPVSVRKQNPREGTETSRRSRGKEMPFLVRKQNPREGTETSRYHYCSCWSWFSFENKIPVRGRKLFAEKNYRFSKDWVRKQNPREGTETL